MECGKEIWCRRKMLRILQRIYISVRYCVRCLDNLTVFWVSYWGKARVCVLSPALFSFLINELALEIAQNGMYGVQLKPDVVQILIMLFADDVLLASNCVAGMFWITLLIIFSVTVNMSKTKIIVFRKRGFFAADEDWRYSDKEIEVVNSFKYLGLYFTTKLSDTSCWRFGWYGKDQNQPDTQMSVETRKCTEKCIFLKYFFPDPTDSYVWIRAVGFPIVRSDRKSARFLANDFWMLACKHQAKLSMVTWEDILCLLHILYDV